MAEDQNIEWKTNWNDEYLKWICGFANANGGKLYIGKDNKGEITGLRNIHKLLQDLPNKIRDILGILVDVNLLREDGKEYLEINVEPYPSPISYKGRYYYRSGSTLQELKGIALEKFLLKKQGQRWDNVLVFNASVSDLNQHTIDFFKNRALKSNRIDDYILSESADILLENLQLLEKGKPKRAAILLFHSNPEKFIPGAFVKIGFFKTDEDIIFQDEIHGNLFEQVEKTMEILFTKYIKAIISYEGIHRVENFEYPKDAVREALLNALAHKDYSGAAPVQISVYDEKIIFWNEGQLPENWTVEMLKQKHPSKPFNPLIANAFFRSGYIEAWGRGTLKMMTLCKEAGLPEPEYRYDAGGYWVVFRKDIYTEQYLKDLGLNERQIKAVMYVKRNGKITNKIYQQINNISKRTATNELKSLVDDYNLLAKTGKHGAGIAYVLIGQ